MCMEIQRLSENTRIWHMCTLYLLRYSDRHTDTLYWYFYIDTVVPTTDVWEIKINLFFESKLTWIPWFLLSESKLKNHVFFCNKRFKRIIKRTILNFHTDCNVYFMRICVCVFGGCITLRGFFLFSILHSQNPPLKNP